MFLVDITLGITLGTLANACVILASMASLLVVVRLLAKKAYSERFLLFQNY